MYLTWLDRNYQLNKMWYSGSSLSETSHSLLCLTWGKKHSSLSIMILSGLSTAMLIQSHPVYHAAQGCRYLWARNCCMSHTSKTSEIALLRLAHFERTGLAAGHWFGKSIVYVSSCLRRSRSQFVAYGLSVSWCSKFCVLIVVFKHPCLLVQMSLRHMNCCGVGRVSMQGISWCRKQKQ